MRILLNLSLGVALAVSGACSGTSTLGTSNQSTTGNEADGASPEGSAGSGSGGTGAAGSAGSRNDEAGPAGSGGAGGAAPGSCTTSAECPDPTCIECPDRSQICPGFQCVEGRCLPERHACPAAIFCDRRADCPVTRGLCVQCPDGQMSCQDYACEQNVCVLVQPPCGQIDNPCGGKRCGDWCGACEQGSPVCFGAPAHCNATGECVVGAAAVCE